MYMYMYTERERNFAYTHSLSHTHTQEFCVAMCVVSVYCNKPFSCWVKRAVPDSLNTYTNLPASYKLPVHKHTHTYTHTRESEGDPNPYPLFLTLSHGCILCVCI
jgi:hypothetical protein